MKKKWVLALFAAICMSAAPQAAYAQEAAEAAQEQDEVSGDIALTENIYDFQVQIDKMVYQFPMAYEDFEAQGWTIDKNDDPQAMLGTNTYGMLRFHRGEDTVTAYVINFKINECPVSESLVAGISLEGNGFGIDYTASSIALAKGITMGQSNADDIKAAYGEPSDVYESDLYTKMTYEMDSYESVELYVYKDENVLKEVDIRNFTEPEGFDKGEVSTETPEIVASYTAPAALGKDMMDPVVEFCGDLYTLPCPVTALEANGWVMKDVAKDAFVSGRGLEFIEMMKNNQTVRFSVYNKTENAVMLNNCFVEELEAATYDPATITLKLSGDITLGAKKSDLIAAAEEKGYLYEDKDGYLTIYKSKDTKLDTQIEIWFNEDVDPEAAASITYHNEVLPAE